MRLARNPLGALTELRMIKEVGDVKRGGESEGQGRGREGGR